MSLPFLTARWANLIVVNYAVPAEILEPFRPREVEVDFFEGHTFISLVAFQFLKNKLLGFFPSYPNYQFKEINLRYYVKLKNGNEERRGVAFIKEFVPSKTIATTARVFYEEPYESVPMFHDFSSFDSHKGGSLIYGLKKSQEVYSIKAVTTGPLNDLKKGSLEEFILEHYWGYTARSDGSTSEYEVKHPRWRVWDVEQVEISANFGDLYPSVFREVLSSKPHSTFVAEGSNVSVHHGRRITPKVNRPDEPCTQV